jgi:polysaccharide export outer membrane protein
MAKSKIASRCGLLLLQGLALLAARMTVPLNAQALPGLPSAQTQSSGASLSSTISKAGGSSQGAGPVIVPPDLSDLRIAPGDLLTINVYDTPEFTDSYRVDSAGDLAIPLCGKVNVGGLTSPEAAKRLEAAFKNSQILTQPQVTVDVLQYAGQYVTVLGEVANPGRVALIAPTKLGDILSQAGGLTPLAGGHVRIRHGSGDTAPEEEVPYSRNQGTQASASALVRPGDSILVPRTGIVYVLGAVYKPGGYIMQEDGTLNVAQAIALSGGTMLQANTGGLRVIRRNPDGTVLDFPLSYDAIAKGTQTPLLLQAQDIVYVPMSKVKAMFSSTEGVLSAAASASIYAGAVY